jgi:hypothetical protein
MTKVLCRGGPFYWIKEPFTKAEQRWKGAYEKWAAEGGEPGTSPWGLPYNRDLFLWDHEALPLTPEEERDFYNRFDTSKMTFIGGAPHRPKG